MSPIFYHTVIVTDFQGNTWEGDVVTHLSLSDWALMKGYTVVSCEGNLPALPFQRTRTHLSPRQAVSGYHYLPSSLDTLLKKQK